ncbi:hypothetical protein B296_00042862 [Ensete ventricosum]|uniref:EF-hand domain-containing protein n=1 Tax=Ensete ventricosum TaxID=4639 RepID=A0A426X891_ENSVE|nr:hypothetical protein B296_00042862 [Ensete ventricosum]
MSGAAKAVEHRIGFPTTMEATAPAADGEQQRRPGGCNPVKKPGPVSMDHVLLALRETKEEREVRIRSLFNFFDAAGLGHLDYAQIEAGLSALRIPTEYKYARDLLKVCDADRDGRVDYQEFRRYMDDKELELYRIFQAIDVEHNGCILPEELWDALIKAGKINYPLCCSATFFSCPQIRHDIFFYYIRTVCFSFTGIEIDDEELARFVEHVDKDNNGIITFEEWRDFLLLYPHEATIENIYQYWERVCLVDIGEQAAIPEGISKHVNASKYLIAGGVAGAASRTATAPLDRLKVVLQVQTTQARIVPAIKHIWREGRFSAFFRGNGLNVMKVAPESAIRFYTFEMLKDFIVKAKGEEKSDIGASGRLTAGGLAGAVAQTAIYPLDLVKTRLQTFPCEGGKVPNLAALAKDIWVHEGPRAFYRGLVPSLLGIIPYAGIDLTAYETLKDMSRTYILKDSGKRFSNIWFFSHFSIICFPQSGLVVSNADYLVEPGPLVQLGCGTISGALGATCVYPLQVIRTR